MLMQQKSTLWSNQTARKDGWGWEEKQEMLARDQHGHTGPQSTTPLKLAPGRYVKQTELLEADRPELTH